LLARALSHTLRDATARRSLNRWGFPNAFLLIDFRCSSSPTIIRTSTYANRSASKEAGGMQFGPSIAFLPI
jgi:hypothetical protein